MTNAPRSIPDLEPRHLLGSEADRKAALEDAAKPPMDVKADRLKRMEERRYTFHFSYQSKRAGPLEGDFTSEIPDQATMAIIGAAKAQLSGYAPWSSLDEEAQGRVHVLANLTYCLKERPKWAEDLGKLLDWEVLLKLWKEVLEHQATFLG